MPKFYALENGTLANPYRFIEKGTEVELTDAQAVVYMKSRWLRPVEEKRKPAPPIMSHMVNTPSRLAEPFKPQAPEGISTDAYMANMAALRMREQNEDAAKVEKEVATENAAAAEATIETAGGDAAEGTGNQDVLG
jgi:hypothetical protein